jgi:hypothetical protein
VVQGFVLLKRYKVGLGVGFCNLVSVKSAVQKTAVGGAKNGGRELEKKPYPLAALLFQTNFPLFPLLMLKAI